MSWVAAGEGLAVTIPAGLPATDTPQGRVIEIGAGAQPVPAPVLPRMGRAVPTLTQDAPPDQVSGWVRISIAGFLADHPGWNGVICARQGALSHWLHVSADEVVSCQSFLTPRLVAALGGATQAAPEAVTDSMSHPGRLAAHLRVAELRGRAEAITGHLIGAELAAARPYWLGQQVALIGTPPLMAAYAEALRAQGGPVSAAYAAKLLPKGLKALATALGLEG
jgi:2-dehydro-3-deoxygalactonokinase